ncbi:MAG: AAA family ATPase [Cyanothece sp. SIO1E1]|nr:AAA family ATPase [Cyanothece sp. SIO1E1]
MVSTFTRINPFPGLRPFEAQEDHLFFGREGQTDELLRKLRRTRFLGVVGTSGSGKSSLVRAGLLPFLYSGYMTQAGSAWQVAIMRPGDAPIHNLATALNHPNILGNPQAPTTQSSPPFDSAQGRPSLSPADLTTLIIETTLRRGALGLIEVVQQARLPQGENLLIVVDQFEELFRFKHRARSRDADDEATAFVKLLLEATQQQVVPIYVVLTMRSDFLGDCAQFRDLPEALNDSQYLIPRMTREQRRAAITGPVAVGGAEIAPRLVNRLLNDVGDNPDQLPILQHALMRTWDYWEGNHQPGEPIDLRHYEAIGGMAQALSNHADEIYDQLPDQRSRGITEKLFKCLTEKADDGRGIRRPIPVREICAVAEAELAEVIAMIEQFRGAGKSFLMPPPPQRLEPETVIDISHESLMRVWQRLKNWVEAEAQSAQIYRRLADTAAMQQVGRAGYWRDPELTFALNWQEDNQPNGAWAERYDPAFERVMAFLAASAAAREREVAEQEVARRREVRRLRGFIALLLGLSLLAIGAAWFAFIQRQEADAQRQRAEEALQDVERQRRIAQTNAEEAENNEQKATQQAKLAGQNEQLAKQQAELAQKRSQEAEEARTRAEDAQRIEAEQRAEALKQSKIATEQRNLAQQGQQQAEEAQERAELEAAKAEKEQLNAEIFAQSLEAENLFNSHLELEALIKGVATGKRVKALKQSGQPIRPATQTRAIGSLRQVVYSMRERNRLEGHSGWVRSVSVSRDGQTIVSGGDDGSNRHRCDFVCLVSSHSYGYGLTDIRDIAWRCFLLFLP